MKALEDNKARLRILDKVIARINNIRCSPLGFYLAEKAEVVKTSSTILVNVELEDYDGKLAISIFDLYHLNILCTIGRFDIIAFCTIEDEEREKIIDSVLSESVVLFNACRLKGECYRE